MTLVVLFGFCVDNRAYVFTPPSCSRAAARTWASSSSASMPSSSTEMEPLRSSSSAVQSLEELPTKPEALQPRPNSVKLTLPLPSVSKASSQARSIVPKRLNKYLWKSRMAMAVLSFTTRSARGLGSARAKGATSYIMPFRHIKSRVHFPSFQYTSPLPPAPLFVGFAVTRWKPPHVPLTTKCVSRTGTQLSGSRARGLRP
mmetsp:Transcript_95365/g.269458  ORF Transcript_95365/g.269458 Transcript_95365/m.269458 type:complete len:201 (+) Transcript_95365:214-816(+)